MDPIGPSIGHILIIDQERAIADIIIAILTDAGYRAYTVRDSADALAVIAMVPPALIVLDVGKHIVPGAALIDQVCAAGLGAIPIIVMTTDFVDTAPVLVAPSVVACLAKPFDLDDVLDCIARYGPPQTVELVARTVGAQESYAHG